jgi:hypothetical protein
MNLNLFSTYKYFTSLWLDLISINTN